MTIQDKVFINPPVDMHEPNDIASLLHTISNNLPGIMIYQLVRDPDGSMRFTYLSESVEKLTGKTPGQVIHDPRILYNLIDQDDRLKFKKAKEISYQRMSLLDVVVRAHNNSGNTRWLHIRSLPRKLNDGKVAWDGVYMDITETMEKEKQIGEKEAQLRLFVENSPAAIAMLDLNLNYIIASKRWKQDYDLGNIDINGKNHYEIFPDIPDEWKMVHKRCLAGAIEKKEEDLFIRQDGRKEWVRWEIHPWYTISGEVGGLILLTEVMTEKKNAEELLKHSLEDIRRLASHLEKIREEERIAIAREIHDELGQQLTVLKMDISWINKNLSLTDEQQILRMKDLLQTIDNTIRSVRRISSELRPSVLDDLGLIAAFEWLIKDFEKRSGIKATLVSEIEEVDLDINAKTALFRVFQESITNVARHAHATQVTAFLKKENEDLLITIKDNGKGFDISSIENKETLGILGIKERIAIIKGTYAIDSIPGEGTTIEIKVPVSSEART